MLQIIQLIFSTAPTISFDDLFEHTVKEGNDNKIPASTSKPKSLLHWWGSKSDAREVTFR